MPRIDNSIVIQAPVGRVYNTVNDIDRWPEFFDDYQKAEVTHREDGDRFSVLSFRLQNAMGSWESRRLIDHKTREVYAERIDPLFPFAFMHLRWTFHQHPEGTLMRWVQDYELDPGAPLSVEESITRMNEHTRTNQDRIRRMLEQHPMGCDGDAT